MKKAAVFIATVILFALCAASALADEGALPEDQTIDVYAKAVYTLPESDTDGSTSGGAAAVSAKTGDSSTPALWFALLLTSAAAGAVLYTERKSI